ncbi:peptidoglycan editing factor PgeF [Candidatus Daviesbacteria bacterium]|nr:peptidoglycan editing factor PgeF [Candidatus Daviesbacteria bacterium]
MIRFKIFEPYPQLFYTFSQKQDGGMSSSTRGFIKNRKNFFNKVNIPAQQVVMAGQIHSHNIAEVVEGAGGRSLKNVDGLITYKKNIFLAGKSADCILAFFYAPTLAAVAVIHAGWRGILAGVAQSVVERLNRLGEKPQQILVVLGPSIRGCHYQVQDDVAGLFAKEFSEQVLARKNGQTFLDLQGSLIRQLSGLGILPEHVEDCRICTYESKDFFSARRDQPQVESFLGIVGIEL